MKNLYKTLSIHKIKKMYSDALSIEHVSIRVFLVHNTTRKCKKVFYFTTLGVHAFFNKTSADIYTTNKILRRIVHEDFIIIQFVREYLV